MLFFENDYAEGAHEAILRRLTETNREQTPGYGNDPYCQAAKEKIRAACECPGAEVSFLVGGTQTNATVINALLRPFEGAIAPATGHIAVHEGGAIEHTGHKVLALPHRDGKLSAGTLREYLETFYADEAYEHMVIPGMVYISHPTEYGTLYSLAELTALAVVCRDYRIPLYLDGARLGYGLVSRGTDVTLPDLARLCDVFYIGGTKMGALCGEAVVFPRGNVPAHFLTMVKQSGALLAKGRLLGIQFDTLFTDGLYLELGRHAIEMADLLRGAFREKGYRFYVENPTNQIFVLLKDADLERLKAQAVFGVWGRVDATHTLTRFATSWATRREDVERLITLL